MAGTNTRVGCTTYDIRKYKQDDEGEAVGVQGREVQGGERVTAEQAGAAS